MPDAPKSASRLVSLAITPSRRAKSSTLVPIGPIVSLVDESGTTPPVGYLPVEGGTPLCRIKRLVSAPIPCIRSQTRNKHTGGYRSSRTSRRTTGYFGFVPRVSNSAMAGIIGGYAIGQLMKIGLCTGDGAFLSNLCSGGAFSFAASLNAPVPPVVISMDVSILSLIIRGSPSS